MNPFNLGLAMLFHPLDAFVVIKRRYKQMSVWPAICIFVLMIVIRYLTELDKLGMTELVGYYQTAYDKFMK